MLGNYSSYLLYALLVALAGLAVSQGEYRMASAWLSLVLLRWLMRDGQKYLQDSLWKSLTGLAVVLGCMIWFLISVVIQAQHWFR